MGVPLVQRRQLILQHNNSRPRVRWICRNFLANHILLGWPPYSPDLFPLEHMLDKLDKRYAEPEYPYHTRPVEKSIERGTPDTD